MKKVATKNKNKFWKEILLIVLGVLIGLIIQKAWDFFENQYFVEKPETDIFLLQEDSSEIDSISKDKKWGPVEIFLESIGTESSNIQIPVDPLLYSPAKFNIYYPLDFGSGVIYNHIILQNRGEEIDHNIRLEIHFELTDKIEDIHLPSVPKNLKIYKNGKWVKLKMPDIDYENIKLVDGGKLQNFAAFEIKKLYPNSTPQVFVFVTTHKSIPQIKAWSEDSKSINNIFIFKKHIIPKN